MIPTHACSWRADWCPHTHVFRYRDQDLLGGLKSLVTIEPCEGGIKPTGIPPHVDTIVRLEKLLTMQQKILDLQAELVETVRTTVITTICGCLEERADEAGQVTVQSMRAALAAQQCSTEQAVTKTIQSEMVLLRAAFQGMPRAGGVGSPTAPPSTVGSSYGTFLHDGKMWCLPKNYIIPTNSVPRATGWDLWMRGDKAKGIGPFRELSPKMMSTPQKAKYQMMKGFYSYCEEGLSAAVPDGDKRGPDFMTNSEKEVTTFLKLRASFLWQAPTGRKKKKRDLASWGISTWHKETKPCNIRKRGTDSDKTALANNTGSNKRRHITPATVEDSEENDDAAGGAVPAVTASTAVSVPATSIPAPTLSSQLGNIPGMAMFAARAQQVLSEASEARASRARQIEDDGGASASA